MVSLPDLNPQGHILLVETALEETESTLTQSVLWYFESCMFLNVTSDEIILQH